MPIFLIFILKKNTFLVYYCYVKEKTILHELAHIELNHIGQINKELFLFRVNKYEDEADSYIKFLLE